jgi:aminoglycoside/choline kinase family phosphotransferase
MDHRKASLENWLQQCCQFSDYKLIAMPGDASFRRYFRIFQGGQSYVAMDAPLERENNCQPFVAIANALRTLGLQTPEVISHDFAQGFLLLSDLGDRLFLTELNATNASILYEKAINALTLLQSCRVMKDWTLPFFTADFMYKELQLFKEWFLLQHLGLSLTTKTETMLSDFFYFLAQVAASQPHVFMHRDYHSTNLMIMSDERIGILDFQDAFIGPVTYDLVSLLRDCYIAWPENFVTQFVLYYKQKMHDIIHVSDNEFLRWFDLMGMQRHLKALLTFSRKYHRDENASYLQHIPRTLQYVTLVAPRYSEAHAFNDFLNEWVIPTSLKVTPLCVQ